jgi:hypothetical protein
LTSATVAGSSFGIDVGDTFTDFHAFARLR